MPSADQLRATAILSFREELARLEADGVDGEYRLARRTSRSVSMVEGETRAVGVPMTSLPLSLSDIESGVSPPFERRRRG